MRVSVIVLAVALVAISAVNVRAGGAALPNYKQTLAMKVRLAPKVPEVYILDVFDVDGDGAADFAISGESTGSSPLNGKPTPGPLVHEFVVRNDAHTGKLSAFDLGPDALTHRTWAGMFYKDPRDGKVFLVLGRNGEQGIPSENHGELASVIEITPNGTTFETKTAFVDARPGTTTSVSGCDFAGDGTEQIYVNNYGQPGGGQGAPVLLHRDEKGEWSDWSVTAWMWFSQFPNGALNSVRFFDVDGDGRCDFLAALEVSKWGAANDAAATFPGVNASFALLNLGDKFSGKPVNVPNPYFGDDQHGEDFAMTVVNGRKIGIVDSSKFHSHTEYMKGFVLQAYEFKDGTFTEVTKDVLKGAPKEFSANGHFILFDDFDHDGDPDMYFSTYDHAIYVYRNDNGVFTLTPLLPDDGQWTKAVAFLPDASAKCDDLVVLDQNQTLKRYACK